MKKIIDKIIRVSLVTVGLFVVFGANTIALGGVSEGFSVNPEGLKVGMAVSRITNQEGQAELTTPSNSTKFIGIVATIDENIVSVTDNQASVLVAKDGEVSAYVSDLNGDVNQGDLLEASPLRGVLMKASTNSADTTILGVASQNIADISTTELSVSDNSGSQKSVQAGLLKVDISRDKVAQNASKSQPSFLILFGESLTGKSVSQVQVLAALLVLLVVLVIEGSIIYGAVNSSITALGRNPLSKKAAFKQLLQVSWLSIVVLIFGIGAIYLILWI